MQHNSTVSSNNSRYRSQNREQQPADHEQNQECFEIEHPNYQSGLTRRKKLNRDNSLNTDHSIEDGIYKSSKEEKGLQQRSKRSQMKASTAASSRMMSN